MKYNKKSKGFTLIELLVVIAIIAILAVVVILTLNPAELLRQARDSSRVSDFATLKSSIGLYQADVSTTTVNIGNSATGILYSSSILGTVTNAQFTSSTGNPNTGWGFAGAETSTLSSTVRSVNGTGWLPINFSVISSGAPIGSLPIDPVDTGALMYVWTTSGSYYKLATKTESLKYSTGGSGDVESTDGGNSTDTYEQGTNITGL